MPKISICIPSHKEMKNYDFFLNRALESIRSQTFQDFEIVNTENGKGMASNTNSAIKQATGLLVKILYMDDWLYHKDVLQNIWDNFEFGDDWMISGATTNPHPYWTDDIETGNNHLGSPSALTMRRKSAMMFDERMSWLLDCDLYRRLYDEYGPPKFLDSIEIGIGVGDHQMTHILTDEEKLKEHKLIQKKYA
jgi:hypothetical protein